MTLGACFETLLFWVSIFFLFFFLIFFNFTQIFNFYRHKYCRVWIPRNPFLTKMFLHSVIFKKIWFFELIVDEALVSILYLFCFANCVKIFLFVWGVNENLWNEMVSRFSSIVESNRFSLFSRHTVLDEYFQMVFFHIFCFHEKEFWCWWVGCAKKVNFLFLYL